MFNKIFKLIIAFLILCVAIWQFTENNTGNGIMYIFISLIFLLLGSINSKLLNPLNKIWIKFGEILGTFIAPIIMSIVYFIILTPVSFIVRIFGKDLLGLKFLKERDSYWIKRKKKLGSMRKQF